MVTEREDISYFLQNRKQIEFEYKEKGYVAVIDKKVIAYSHDFHSLSKLYRNAVIREIHSDFANNTAVQAEFINGVMQSFELKHSEENNSFLIKGSSARN